MDNDHFEQQVQEKLHEFAPDPPDEVWQAINIRLNAQNKKRRVLFWLLPLSILSALITIRLVSEKEQEPVQLKQQNQHAGAPKTDQQAKKLSNAASNETDAVRFNPDKEHYSTVIHPSPDFNIKTNPTQPEPLLDTTHDVVFQPHRDLLPHSQLQDSNTIGGLHSPELMEPIRLSNLLHPPKIPLLSKLDLDTIIVIACFPQHAKPEKSISWHYSGAYSFHGTGDLEGMQLEWGISKPINRYFSFYNNIGVSLHGGSVIQISSSSFTPASGGIQLMGVGSIYEISSGIQTAPTLLGSIPGTPLRIGMGGLLRYQFYSGGAGYSIRQSQYPLTFIIRDGNYNGISLGYRVVVGIELLRTKRNKLQLQAGFQNDTRGDVITGLGLSWQHLKK